MEEKEDIWLVWFDDPDRKPVFFSGYGAESAAHRYYLRMLGAWSCRLFKTIEFSPEAANN